MLSTVSASAESETGANASAERDAVLFYTHCTGHSSARARRRGATSESPRRTLSLEASGSNGTSAEELPVQAWALVSAPALVGSRWLA
jgi:hypothetical protein